MINLELTEKEKQGLTEEEIEIAMARKLEILILPHLRRNIKFFYAGGDLKGKAQAYREIQNEEDLENALNSNESLSTVCKPLCIMVAEILKDNGIDAKTVSCDTDMFRHTDVLITTKSGKKYIINYLEDMEMIQTGMSTPDFAGRKYYERRYKKFEGTVTTDGKSLEGIDFISEDTLDKIDGNLGYKRYGMYMDVVIEQIRNELKDYRQVMAENNTLLQQLELKDAGKTLSEEELEAIRRQEQQKYDEMTDDEILEQKLDWIFSYFNDRGDIKGHTDFVMYYSRLLLKAVLSDEEYNKLTRYDCFAYLDKVPDDSEISDILDYDNQEDKNKNRFCMIKLNGTYYAFSTKPNSYKKLSEEEIKEIEKYSIISKSDRPSDLMLFLCDRGNALPLVFHPLGAKILNERAELIDENLSEEQRREAVKKLSDSIKTTDEPVTSILIPYPDGSEKYIYINENDEFVVETSDKKTIYHYREQDDNFEEEIEGR